MALSTKSNIFVAFAIILFLVFRFGAGGLGFIFVIVIFFVAIGLKHPEIQKMFGTPSKEPFKIVPEKTSEYASGYEQMEEVEMEARDDILEEEFRREKEALASSIRNKVWWKDTFARPFDLRDENFKDLMLDERGMHYHGKTYRWDKIKRMHFTFGGSHRLALELKKGLHKDFIPGGKRLLTLRTGNLHRWKSYYVKVVDIQGFMEQLKKNNLMYKYKKK